MLDKTLLIFVFLLNSGFVYSGTSGVTNLKGDIHKLQKSGVKMGSSSELMLNQHLKNSRAVAGQYYQVKFICKHNKQMDKCKLVKVNFKK